MENIDKIHIPVNFVRITENIRRHKGDQDWLSRVFPEDTKKWWPKEWAMSYKWEVLNGGLKRMGTTEYKSDRTVLHDDTSWR